MNINSPISVNSNKHLVESEEAITFTTHWNKVYNKTPLNY